MYVKLWKIPETRILLFFPHVAQCDRSKYRNSMCCFLMLMHSCWGHKSRTGWQKRVFKKWFFSSLGQGCNNNIKISKWNRANMPKSSNAGLFLRILHPRYLDSFPGVIWVQAPVILLRQIGCCVDYAAVPSCRPWACSTDTNACWFLMFVFTPVLA